MSGGSLPGALLLAALTAGCLDSPPSSAVEEPPDAGDTGDAALPGCAGLDRLIESFEEPDPVAVFDALWDPGAAQYVLADGALVLTAIKGDSIINSIDAWGATGALRVGPIELDPGGTAAINTYGASGSVRIAFDDAVVNLYHVDDNVTLDREPLDDFYAIAFEEDEVVFSASDEGLEWRVLQRWPTLVTEPSRISLSVRNVEGTSELTVHGINTPETGAPCRPE